MKTNRPHNDMEDRVLHDSLPKLDIPYTRSKEDVWAALSFQIDEAQEEQKPQAKKISLRHVLIRIVSIAAIFAIVVGVSAAIVYKIVNDIKEEVQPSQVQVAPTIEIKNGLFIFTDATLSDTFAEIAKEYDVQIEYRDSAERLYSGRFKRSLDIDEALLIVCRSMQLKYKQIENKYIITKQ